jgi:hypothetical protein
MNRRIALMFALPLTLIVPTLGCSSSPPSGDVAQVRPGPPPAPAPPPAPTPIPRPGPTNTGDPAPRPPSE